MATTLLALIGVDYLDTRNVLVAWPPLALAVAAGLGARAAGTAGACGGRQRSSRSVRSPLSLVNADATLQRDDWRGVAEALGEPQAEPRAVVVTPFTAEQPFAVYAPEPGGDAGRGDAGAARSTTSRSRDASARGRGPATPPRPEDHPPPAPGFTLAETRFEDTFTLLRYTRAGAGAW